MSTDEAEAALAFAESFGVTVMLKDGHLVYRGKMRPALRQALKANKAWLPAALRRRAQRHRQKLEEPRPAECWCAGCGTLINPWATAGTIGQNYYHIDHDVRGHSCWGTALEQRQIGQVERLRAEGRLKDAAFLARSYCMQSWGKDKPPWLDDLLLTEKGCGDLGQEPHPEEGAENVDARHPAPEAAPTARAPSGDRCP